MKFKLFLTLLLITLCSGVLHAQQPFSLNIPRTNLVVKSTSNDQWVFSEQLSANLIGKVNSPHVFVQIIRDSIWVYEVTEVDLKSKKHISHKVPLLASGLKYYDNMHQVYYSAWLSQQNGHIVLSNTDVKVVKNGEEFQNIKACNSLYLKRNARVKIETPHTYFIIPHKDKIYQVDTLKNLWREFDPTHKFSAWKTEAPPTKFIHELFPDYRHLQFTYMGKENNLFKYQTKNDRNESGIATINPQLNELIEICEPNYQFISPSLASKYQLTINNYQVHLTNPEFTFHETLAVAHEPIELTDSATGITLGINFISDSTIIYNEYDEEGTVHYGGIYHLTRGEWFLSPTHHQLISYPTHVLEIIPKTTPLYTVFSPTGYQFLKKVKVTQPEFDQLLEMVTNTNINQLKKITLVGTPSEGTFTYRHKKNQHTLFLHQGIIKTEPAR